MTPMTMHKIEMTNVGRRNLIVERRRDRSPNATTRKNGVGRFFTMAQLTVVLAVSILLLSTPTVHSKSPSLFPRNNQHRRGRSSSMSIKNSDTIRYVSTVTSPGKPQEAAWVSGFKNSLASGLAAGCSKLLLAPLDTIKTLQQAAVASGTTSLSVSQAAQQILKRPKGFLEFYAGVGVAVIGSMPSVGLYFGLYSFCKKTFQHRDPENYEQRQTFYIGLSAAIGNTIASASRVPYEVVKQKLQTQAYANFGEAMRDMSFRTLFPTGGIASQTLRDVPYAIVTLLTYEYLKSNWKTRAQQRYPTVPTRSWDLLVGGLSGGLGSFVTNPMDVIKTRLQIDSQLYSGSIRTCAMMTFAEGGAAAFLRGSVPRLLHKIPANSFFFLFYEFFRSVLRVQDDAAVGTAKNVKR
uniref:Mitochondrial carrier protein n=1 Tax=Pseudo-nitzschia australis TaxID=44445 RepID=A0A7S4AXD9_9STRA|mmetsp:Transcript_23/g.52  ORF Transcript_23/g.52 Transcript_23/m.52 type:complete len:407 (-) Transcript_23:23-1243(-)